MLEELERSAATGRSERRARPPGRNSQMDEPVDAITDLTQLVESLPSALYVCEAPSGLIRFYNHRAAELWGRAPRPGDTDEVYCGSFRLFRPDGRLLARADTPMAEVLRDGVPRSDEVVIERPDGSRVSVHVNVAPLREPGGRLVGAVNVFQEVPDRRRAEEALRLTEARYRAIVDDHPDLVCRFLPDGTLTFANDAYCGYFGFRREDVIGQKYRPVVHPDDVPRVEALVASLSPSNRMVVIENRVVRADGQVRWTEWTNHALYDDRDRLLELQSAGRDITDRRRAEEDAARLAAVVASADEAILSKTLDGVITSWNRAAERTFGYTAAEAVGQPVTLIIPPDRHPEESVFLARLRRGEAVEPVETERLAKDGRRVFVSLTVSPIRDSTGRIIGASTIARDISERRRAEEQRRTHVRSLEMLYRLTESLSRAPGLTEVCEAAVDAIMAAGRADRASILLFDERAVMRFRAWRGLSAGYRAAVEGHSPWAADAQNPVPILVEDVLADPAAGGLRDVIAAEGIRAIGFIPIVALGRLLGKFMVYYNTPHAFAEEEQRLIGTVTQHVAFGLARLETAAAMERLLRSERAARADADAARREAERANQSKDEFLAMLAHELRNPISVIAHANALLETLQGLPPDPERARLVIRRQTDHLTRLLDDLLDVARITSGRIDLDRERVDLRTAVELAVEDQRHRIEARRQQLRLALPEQALPVDGDRVRLRQVVGNLLSNASKYTPAGGSIWVTLGAEGQDAVLRVRDNGSGIPPAKLELIFDLFMQAHPTLARTEGGLGIGLTLAKRVVELHDGTIRAASEGPDQGSEFVVRLPLARAAAEPASRGALRVDLAPRRILVIEDHEDGREMLGLALRSFGHEVYEAATGEAGIDVAIRHAPDVALVDIGLPDVSGYEVARRLRERLGARVRLVALTGYGQPRDRARSEQAGFDIHLVKPVDPAELVEILSGLPAQGA